MDIAIIYTSMSGNTEELAEVIADRIKDNKGTCTMFRAGALPLRLDEFDIVLFGSYTWGQGKTPRQMRNALRTILKENQMPINKAAVFGSGDETFPHFCRAVDEISYHLKKYDVDVWETTLKIEQSCRGSQIKDVHKWIDDITGGIK